LWVDYDGSTNQLHIYLNNTGEAKPADPLATAANLSLTDIFNRSEIYVGFTASTGGYFENQDILSFLFYG